METHVAEPDTATPRRLGPIRLSPGVTPLQIGVFLVVITITMLLFGFVSIIQPYLFSEVMHVPVSHQGRLTGTLNMVQYISVAVCIIGAGTLSDRIGRKPMLLAAMVGFIVTLVLLPLASTIFAAALLRILLGVASTGHTTGGATMMVDYPTNATRGKFISLMLFVQSLATAALAGWVLPHLPAWLISHGLPKLEAARWSVWSLAVLGALGVGIGLFALKPPPRHAPRGTVGQGLKSVAANARQVWALSRKDPAFGLVVLVAFVIRSDYFITSSFLTVWVMDASRQHGVAAATALKTVGVMTMILQLAFAFSPFLFGYLADRVNRTYLLVATLMFAALAFVATGLVADVTSPLMMLVTAAIGVAETGQTVASQAVFGDRAPLELRGSAMGFFVLAGTLSVVMVMFVAGVLFDKIGFTAPFMFLSAMNALFALAAIVLVVRRQGRERVSAAKALA